MTGRSFSEDAAGELLTLARSMARRHAGAGAHRADDYESALGEVIARGHQPSWWWTAIAEQRRRFMRDSGWVRLASARSWEHRFQIDQLERPDASGTSPADYLEAGADPADVVTARDEIARAWAALSPNQRRVAWGRFLGHTGPEIAAEIGLTEARVSQLGKEAAARARLALGRRS